MKRLIGFIALMVMVLMTVSQVSAVQASGEMKLVASDQLRQEMKAMSQEMAMKAFVSGVIASGENSAMFMENNNVSPETISGVLTGYFKDLGLDETYTSFKVIDMEEAKIVAPILDMAVLLSAMETVHNDKGCRKDKDPNIQMVSNSEANLAMIKGMLKNIMQDGEGASYLGEAIAYRTNQSALKEVRGILKDTNF